MDNGQCAKNRKGVPAMEQSLGSSVDLSPTTVTRLTKQWTDDYAAFEARDLSESDYVSVWADGVHPKVRLSQAHSRVLLLMGVRPTAQGTRRAGRGAA
ncbi:transposase [Streptomyces sp. NPDC057298]|uniref:transposase n=1 Tax=Streptomyces sp. NPDC057298 TaxID=3346091 RepID=UPI00362CA547